jgi:serine protease Do
MYGGITRDCRVSSGLLLVSPRPGQKPESQNQLPSDAGELSGSSLVQRLSPAQVFERGSPSVASLFAKDEFGNPAGQGSGFVVSVVRRESVSGKTYPQEVLVLTNYHVIRGAAELEIEFSNGLRLSGYDVRSENKNDDLALVSGVDIAGLVNGKRRAAVFPSPLVLATVDPAIGTRVLAIGQPQGLENTLSEGLISQRRKIEGGSLYCRPRHP